jgi:glycerol-3-phosphate acyltransferase PlsX
MSLPDKQYRIAIDTMGGDFAPLNEIKGAIQAYNNSPKGINIKILLVGKKDVIESHLKELGNPEFSYSIVHAEQIVTMKDDPTAVLKNKKDSSLYVGVDLVRQGKADAFVSAGNTGAVLSTSTILLGRIQGVSRPTIGSYFPGVNKSVLVLDVGANVECKPRFLYDFAVMGSIYIEKILGIPNPKVGLLSIGEEDSKGNELVLQTHKLLKESKLNFAGNIEGRDVLTGDCDVVVCDGFTGNIVLKFAESVFTLLKSKFKEFAAQSLKNKLMMGLSAPVLKKVFADLDYQNYGGVPLLGTNGVIIIGHGKSSPLAIQNMILKAVEQIQKEVNKEIEEALN